MAALQYADVPGYRALILRRTYAQLTKGDALIPMASEWLAGTDAHRSDEGKKWTFPSGATLEFGHVQNEADKYDYQGAAYTFVGFDELTQFTDSIYEYIAFSRQRRRTRMADLGIPIRVRSTANPGGVGHGWVKKRFIDARKPDVAFIPAKVADNPGLDVADYVQSLSQLDPILRQQLLDGNWGVFEGLALPTFGEHNLIDDFPLADSMNRLEGLDYGLNGVAWYLVPSDYEGNVIFHDSIYESNLLPDEVAPLVLAKRKADWGFGNPTFADPSIWHRTGGRNKWGAPAMLADEFTEAGVPVMPANNDPRAGLIRLRYLTKPDPERAFPNWHPQAGELGSPRLFVVKSRCQELVEQWESAPLQPIDKTDAGEKIDPAWESVYGHGCAASRYAVMAKPGPSTEPPVIPDDPRARLLQEVEARRSDPRRNRSRYQRA